ncbi:hypothetical protein [Streptomyces griseus]|uniref:hypothetical protein n=1 Tax=Streptomyces griseus TaxID=1911 RepID=UPI000A3848E1|nr:hypothetical protein [Streptomyces fimicarius]
MTARRTDRIYVDHAAVALAASTRPGEWIRAGAYKTARGAEATASHARDGGLSAYEPAGYYQATVAEEDEGPVLWVRYVGAEGARLQALVVVDKRPVAEVAQKRTRCSDQPARFVTRLQHTLTQVRQGEDVTAAAWDASDPIQLAAEIEALAGLRRLSAFRKDTPR